MLIQLLIFAIGLVGLYFGAEWLVRGAARLARSFGISALVVGLTVVAFGTSAPELAVSVLAAWQQQADVAVGNVIGSNIANLGLILGIAAVIRPMRVDPRLIRGELPLMIAAAVLLVPLVLDSTIGRLDAWLLLGGFVGFLLWILRGVKDAPAPLEAEFESFEAAAALAEATPRRFLDGLLILVGILLLVAGARLLVTSALNMAAALGVPEIVVGVTIVAVGTSLPELATSIVAAIRKEADIAVGNIVGSNIFNTLAILGAAAMTRPLTVEAGVLGLELPAMVALSVLMYPLLRTGLRITRLEGGALVAAYLGFILWLTVTRGVGAAG